MLSLVLYLQATLGVLLFAALLTALNVSTAGLWGYTWDNPRTSIAVPFIGLGANTALFGICLAAFHHAPCSVEWSDGLFACWWLCLFSMAAVAGYIGEKHTELKSQLLPLH